MYIVDNIILILLLLLSLSNIRRYTCRYYTLAAAKSYYPYIYNNILYTITVYLTASRSNSSTVNFNILLSQYIKIVHAPIV